MAKGGVDDGLGHLRAGVNFADAFKPGICLDANEQRVLRAGGFGLHLR
jgi:hypothetical protein